MIMNWPRRNDGREELYNLREQPQRANPTRKPDA
jgi:hypothetical protein